MDATLVWTVVGSGAAVAGVAVAIVVAVAQSRSGRTISSKVTTELAYGQLGQDGVLYVEYASGKTDVIVVPKPGKARTSADRKPGKNAQRNSEFKDDGDIARLGWSTLLPPCRRRASHGAFFPSLGNYQMEKEIHDGRKRIDIVYDNIADGSFFDWIGRRYNCPTVPVECKNYRRDLGNPELDQMIGRFSNNRGRIGIIVCRSFENKDLFIERCRDKRRKGMGSLFLSMTPTWKYWRKARPSFNLKIASSV